MNSNITDEDINALLANSFEVTDDYLADYAPAAPAIEAGDTVRYTGKTTRWIIDEINGDTAEVYAFFGNRRSGQVCRTRTVRLDRLELVRKGNTIDDDIAELDRLFPTEAA